MSASLDQSFIGFATLADQVGYILTLILIANSMNCFILGTQEEC